MNQNKTNDRPYCLEDGCLICYAEDIPHVYQLPASDREVMEIANAAYKLGRKAALLKFAADLEKRA